MLLRTLSTNRINLFRDWKDFAKEETFELWSSERVALTQ